MVGQTIFDCRTFIWGTTNPPHTFIFSAGNCFSMLVFCNVHSHKTQKRIVLSPVVLLGGIWRCHAHYHHPNSSYVLPHDNCHHNVWNLYQMVSGLVCEFPRRSRRNKLDLVVGLKLGHHSAARDCWLVSHAKKQKAHYRTVFCVV